MRDTVIVENEGRLGVAGNRAANNPIRNARSDDTKGMTHIKGLTKPSPRCTCPTCRISQALKTLDGATEEWLNDSEERSMAFAYLRDEVAAVASSPFGFFVRRRLRKALEVTDVRR